MTEDVKKVFSRENIAKDQELKRKEYDEQIAAARQAFELVAATPSGELVFKYLFRLCGGDSPLLRRTKDGTIDVNETIAFISIKSVWENVRYNLSSKTIEKIERHNWEDRPAEKSLT